MSCSEILSPFLFLSMCKFTLSNHCHLTRNKEKGHAWGYRVWYGLQLGLMLSEVIEVQIHDAPMCT